MTSHCTHIPNALSLTLTCIASCSAFGQQTCGDWQRVPTLSPGGISTLLIDVEFSTSQNGIAVGTWSDGILSRRPMIQEWDGSAWRLTDLPDSSHLGTSPSIEGVGIAGNDLWVVGSVITPYPTDHMPLITRRHAGAWDSLAQPTLRPQNTYPFAARGGFAYDVAGVDANDIWVVGTATGYGDATATSVALALHFDGSSWVDVPVPTIGNRTNSIENISVSTPDNAWGVGYWRNIGGAYQALIVRWDGSSWQRVQNPGEGNGGGDAVCVVALSPSDVWVSGNFNSGVDHLIHWNGSSWDVVDAGLPGPFASFAANAPDDIWASCAISSTFYHYDGNAWTPAGNPAIPGSQYVLRGWGMAALGPCEIWSVGGWSNGTSQFTLAERLTPSCAADFNQDGIIDFFDYLDFVDAFAGNLPAADFNRDAIIDFFDYLDFVDRFAVGC